MDSVKIFDTTLRDGEQSPGISLDVSEKLEIADQLARLGVDVIEAGFPIASDGDFESVEAVDNGATTLNIPDTVGFAVPEDYAKLIRYVIDTVNGDFVVSTHCHNDLGL